MTTVKTEGTHDAGFLVSEANGHRSREQVTILAGSGLLSAGQVLSKVTASGKFVPYDPETPTDGSDNAAGILYGAVDASGSDDVQATAVVRDAEINEAELVWSGDDGTADRDAALVELLALGIVAR